MGNIECCGTIVTKIDEMQKGKYTQDWQMKSIEHKGRDIKYENKKQKNQLYIKNKKSKFIEIQKSKNASPDNEKTI